MKDFIRTYKIVIGILLIVLILVVIRFLNGDHFKNGAEKNALAALLKSNIISRSQVKQIEPNATFIYLGSKAEGMEPENIETITMDSEEILNKQNLQLIQKIKGSIVLVSEDQTLSARIWMLLAQKGIDNLYILTDKEDIESFKYKFQPETVN